MLKYLKKVASYGKNPVRIMTSSPDFLDYGLFCESPVLFPPEGIGNSFFGTAAGGKNTVFMNCLTLFYIL